MPSIAGHTLPNSREAFVGILDVTNISESFVVDNRNEVFAPMSSLFHPVGKNRIGLFNFLAKERINFVFSDLCRVDTGFFGQVGPNLGS